MTDEKKLAFLRRLLAILDRNDAHDDIFWRVGEGYADPATFFVNCDGIFYWDGCDAEEVAEGDLDLLEKSYADAQAAHPKGRIWGSLLFCCRKRGMRPQRAAYPKGIPGLWPLIDACGPERVQP